MIIIILKIYTTLFFTGVLYAIASTILGSLFDFLNFDGHVDLHGDVPNFWILPIRPIIIVIFITVFGGIGVMQTKLGNQALYVFMISLLIAVVVSFLVNKFIINPLYKAANTSTASQKELIGHPGIVIGAIVENGFGQVAYVKNGSKYTAPCKHIEGRRIDIGNKVIVVDIKDNVFYVENNI